MTNMNAPIHNPLENKMTFADCLKECISTPGFVENFNRLTGRQLGEALKRTPIERMIDECSGYDKTVAEKQEDDIRAFLEFCYECVWIRLPRQPSAA